MTMKSVPEDTLAHITSYVRDGIPPGGFLRAVFENKLSEAVGRADSHNLEALTSIVFYIYNEIPAVAWGSSEKVQRWLDMTEEERRGYFR